ncbi:hypothetical protein ACFOU2_14755 [Bacillus songklensis]|uniref:Phenylalanyl-tRNA synthetase subunit beta n=1 Tax=Bacillus songklensis TaxID=1069116 RepID=A0ABV8B5U6_9BACI
MKFMKILFFFVIFLALAGFGVYHFGTKIASDKVMDYVSAELENSGEVEKVKEAIERDPQLQAFIKEGNQHIDESKLPFTTKEEAVKTVIKKLGMNEVQSIQSKVKDGVTAEEKQEILNKVESKLTEEEIQALKVLAYKELNQ